MIVTLGQACAMRVNYVSQVVVDSEENSPGLFAKLRGKKPTIDWFVRIVYVLDNCDVGSFKLNCKSKEDAIERYQDLVIQMQINETKNET